MAHEVDHLLEQTQWDLFWILPIVNVVDRPELQFLSCQLDLAFLNCVNRTRAREHELDALIAEVSAAHAGVKSRWTVPSTFRTDPLERALGRNGYKLAMEHRAVGKHSKRAPLPPHDVSVGPTRSRSPTTPTRTASPATEWSTCPPPA